MPYASMPPNGDLRPYRGKRSKSVRGATLALAGAARWDALPKRSLALRVLTVRTGGPYLRLQQQ